MQRTSWGWGSMVMAGAVLLAACTAQVNTGATSRDRDLDDVDAQETAPKKTTAKKTDAGGACSLAASGLSFKKDTCDTCMQQNCCASVVGCFDGDGDCATLNACVDECVIKNHTGSTTPAADGGTTPAQDAGGTAPAPSTNGGKALFLSEVYGALTPTCGTCHGTSGNAPRFFGATAEASYDNLKNLGLTASNGLLNRGAHAGPALSGTQAATVQKWLTAEKSGTGAGNGSGNGNGNGNGGGNGAGSGAGAGAGASNAEALTQCKNACYAKHDKSAATQKTFYVCRTETCAAACATP